MPSSNAALLPIATPMPVWLDPELYPFTPRRFATDEGALSYVDEGAGPPMLFVHGTPSWSFEWRKVIRAMRSKHRCIAPDHLGFGLSDKPTDRDLRPEAHARRLRALVEALDLRDVTLVVHDFGGPIGLPLALSADARVARVVVTNTWMWSSASDPRVTRIDRFVRSALGRFAYLWLNMSVRVLLPSGFADRKNLTSELRKHYAAPLARRRDRAGPYAFALALRGSDELYASLWERRRALDRVRLSIVWGERDRLIDERQLSRWAAAFPEAEVVRVPDAGHFVAEERPEVLVEHLRR